MVSAHYIRILFGIVLSFAVIAIASIINGFDWVLLFPAAVLFLLMALFRLEQLVLITVFLTPLSINLSETPFGFGISLPAEPLIFGLMMITFLKIVMEGGLDRRIVYHPVSILIILHLIWFLVTSVTSSMPIVSLKYSLSRIWFVMVFFYLTSQLFRDFRNFGRFIWYYSVPLLIVIIYTTMRHAAAGFTEEAAHISMTPFYNDHTAYAAALALFLPVMLSTVFMPDKSPSYRILSMATSGILIAAIVLSYTRAAWVGLAVASLALLTLLFKINYKLVLAAIFSFLLLVIVNWTSIIIKLEGNRKQSSTEYAAHLQSISNISTDASNVERINRWSSAFRMFMERPVFGWGPGTYQFKYAPFQLYNEKTVISTNAGNRGNAHSEYIGPLAEQGLMGTLLFILIIVAVILTAARIYKTSDDPGIKILTAGLLLGLITYWVHGFLNYFLDTDKASVPFWAFIAAITALDVYHLRFKGKPTSEVGK